MSKRHEEQIIRQREAKHARYIKMCEDTTPDEIASDYNKFLIRAREVMDRLNNNKATAQSMRIIAEDRDQIARLHNLTYEALRIAEKASYHMTERASYHRTQEYIKERKQDFADRLIGALTKRKS